MYRRTLTVLIPLTLAVVVSGCGTFSDNNAIARVNDTELSQEQFEQQLTDLGATDQDVVPLDPARAAITSWIQGVLIDEEQIADLYDSGPAVSGVVCLQAIVVEDATAAADTVAELESGTSFEAVFEAANIDPSIAGDLGAVPCITSVDIEASADIPLIVASMKLSESESVGSAPLLDETGQEIAHAVIVFRTYENLGLNDIDVVAASVDVSSELAEADIYVDPRYGTFDADTGQVVSLG
ncbi:MAG: hypothetical protein DRJ50_01385 [Actinobacteria bacterium]|nr:MAG: hypothetical protein DRJ50_01385 [Actinomycetota bacterium]